MKYADDHQYVDDTTLNMHCKPGNLESTVTAPQTDVTELEHWTTEAKLVLNP